MQLEKLQLIVLLMAQRNLWMAGRAILNR